MVSKKMKNYDNELYSYMKKLEYTEPLHIRKKLKQTTTLYTEHNILEHIIETDREIKKKKELEKLILQVRKVFYSIRQDYYMNNIDSREGMLMILKLKKIYDWYIYILDIVC